MFFDEVRVPVENVIGEMGDGWRIATSVLEEERINIGSPVHALRAFVRLKAVLEQFPEQFSKNWASRLENAEFGVETVVAAYLEAKERQLAGSEVAGRTSYLKLLSTEVTHEILSLLVEASAAWAAVAEPVQIRTRKVGIAEIALLGRRMGIYGGSSEILRSILAKRTLNL